MSIKYKEYELKAPFILKHSIVGWWVDGYCGYPFVCKYKTRKECMKAFREKVK
jgi:hypothetical protein